MIFKSIATMILLSFCICYFGKMLLQRRKGIQTDHMGKGKVGFAKNTEVTVKIATCTAFFIEIISIFFLRTMSPLWLQWLGAVLGVWGVVVFASSAVLMLHLRIVTVEENFSEATFGTDYLNYKKQYTDT